MLNTDFDRSFFLFDRIGEARFRVHDEFAIFIENSHVSRIEQYKKILSTKE